MDDGLNVSGIISSKVTIIGMTYSHGIDIINVTARGQQRQICKS